jgi:hypothetical protein
MNQLGDRQIFSLIKKNFGAPKGVATQNSPAPGSLRAEVTLINSTSRYKFEFKSVSGVDLPTEQKLDRNDQFIVLGWQLALGKQDVLKVGKTVKQFYPNPTLFTYASNFDVTDMEAIYNGTLQLKNGQVNEIEAMPLDIFRIVDTSQKSASIANSEYNVRKNVYSPGNITILRGTQNFEIWVDIPMYANIALASPDASYKHQLILTLYGYLAKNAAAVDLFRKTQQVARQRRARR